MNIGAVVVTYNSSGCIQKCMEGLLSSPLVTQVVVVDNASADDTLRLAGAFDSRVITVPLPNNAGFGAAANRGASRVTAPLLAFVNPDAAISDESFRALVAALERAPSVWAVGPALLNESGFREYSARGYPSEWSTLLNRRFLQMFPRSRNRELGRFLMLNEDRSATFECDWLSGALFLMRRSDFLAVGGFDERFFMYYEDADLFRRRGPGRSALFVGSAVAMHSIGGSSNRIPVRAGAWRVRSSWRYYRKHLHRGLGTVMRYMVATGSGVLLELASVVRKRR